MNRRERDKTERDKLDFPFPNWVHRHRKDLRPSPTVGVEGEENLARQEFKKDADINNIVARLLAGQPVPMAQAKYGEADYTLDLQAAYGMADSLVDEYNKLPSEVRQHMNKTAFVNALLEGQTLEDILATYTPNEKQTPTETVGKEDTGT